MKTVSFVSASILLAFVALIFHSIAREQIVEGQHLKAKRIESAIKQHITIQPDAREMKLSSSWRRFSGIGMVFTFSSLSCLVVARRQKEAGYYSIPILLLLSDIMVQLLL